MSKHVQHTLKQWSALQGRILLPGAAMFEMVRAAAACLCDGAAGEHSCNCVQQVTWRRSLRKVANLVVAL